MKRILFLAPSSIPINGPEAICNIKILKVLCSMGFEIDLISRDIFNARYPAIYEDKELQSSLNSIKMIHVSNRLSLKTIREHLSCLLKTGFVYRGCNWVSPALKYAETLIADNHYDYIFTRNSPSELLGVYLAQKYNIKLIVNFNDPYPIKRYPFPYGEGIDAKLGYFRQKLLCVLARKAYKFSFPSERLRDYMLQSLPDVPIERTFVIPHIVEYVKKREDAHMNFCLVSLGDTSFPRNPQNFLLALRELIEKGKIIYVDFIGRVDPELYPWIIQNNLSDYVRILPSRTYQQALDCLKEYHAALIIEAPCKEGIFLPTKVSDYLQEGIPIFSCSPKEGVLNDLYKDKIIDYFADINSVPDILRVLEKFYMDFEMEKEVVQSKNISNMLPTSAKECFNQVLS